MRREFKVLSVLHRAYPLAPQAYLHCADPGILGAEFIVMERRHGLVVRRALPEAYAGIPDAPRQMSLGLVDALAGLHAVDYEALGLGDLGKPAGFVERQIEGWHQRWQAAKSEEAEAPEMEAVYAWLKAHVPAPAGWWPSSIGIWPRWATRSPTWARCWPIGPSRPTRPTGSSYR